MDSGEKAWIARIDFDFAPGEMNDSKTKDGDEKTLADLKEELRMTQKYPEAAKGRIKELQDQISKLESGSTKDVVEIIQSNEGSYWEVKYDGKVVVSATTEEGAIKEAKKWGLVDWDSKTKDGFAFENYKGWEIKSEPYYGRTGAIGGGLMAIRRDKVTGKNLGMVSAATESEIHKKIDDISQDTKDEAATKEGKGLALEQLNDDLTLAKKDGDAEKIKKIEAKIEELKKQETSDAPDPATPEERKKAKEDYEKWFYEKYQKGKPETVKGSTAKSERETEDRAKVLLTKDKKTKDASWCSMPLYKELTPYSASEIAEGFGSGEGASGEDQMVAWQYLHDTKLAYSLQGFYGRTAQQLIANGQIDA
jgi:hypothetical protein